MPAKIFFDLSRIDPKHIQIPIEEIRRLNPHRHEFEQIDGVYLLLPQENVIAGFKDVRSDEFWVRGHFPGNPLLPGVLMLEAAAQLCSIYQYKVCPPKGYFGFGGIDGVKFRAAVRPGDRLILLGRVVQLHSRRSIFSVQGVVGDRLAMEATITGVGIPAEESSDRQG
jgi:3-hydroxyacyl-[acyl-carrier-protein] dehydratase